MPRTVARRERKAKATRRTKNGRQQRAHAQSSRTESCEQDECSPTESLLEEAFLNSSSAEFARSSSKSNCSGGCSAGPEPREDDETELVLFGHDICLLLASNLTDTDESKGDETDKDVLERQFSADVVKYQLLGCCRGRGRCCCLCHYGFFPTHCRCLSDLRRLLVWNKRATAAQQTERLGLISRLREKREARERERQMRVRVKKKKSSTRQV